MSPLRDNILLPSAICADGVERVLAYMMSCPETRFDLTQVKRSSLDWYANEVTPVNMTDADEVADLVGYYKDLMAFVQQYQSPGAWLAALNYVTQREYVFTYNQRTYWRVYHQIPYLGLCFGPLKMAAHLKGIAPTLCVPAGLFYPPQQ